VRTRVLIVDDDPRFRALARALLEASGYTVADEAADGEQALDAARRLRPDAALVDVQLPDTNGLALARRLAESDPGLRIVLTSTDPTLVAPAALAESGALAFVPKDELAVTDLSAWLDGGPASQPRVRENPVAPRDAHFTRAHATHRRLPPLG
jgi:DNA-binding NarL/FixJ family response regulator